jgi:aryl-alcohol dehydrogenase-like predicted oxidoreductase
VCEIANSRGKEPAQIALSWVKDRPGVTSPILGAPRNVEQLDKNLGATGWSLEERELNSLEEVSAPSYAYPYNTIALVNA